MTAILAAAALAVLFVVFGALGLGARASACRGCPAAGPGCAGCRPGDAPPFDEGVDGP